MTEHHPDRKIAVTLRVLTVPACPDGNSTLACLNCRQSLDIHQPDASLPDRMLATCAACRAWHLIDSVPSPGDTLIVLLPDCAPFHKASRPGPAVPKAGPRRGTGAHR